VHSARVLSVLLIEHPAAVRRALRASLLEERDLQVVGESGTLSRALPLAERLQPDAIVLDAEMAGLEVPRAATALHAHAPRSLMVIVAIEPDRLARSFAQDRRVVIVSKTDGAPGLAAALRRAAG
jgi:two-component system, NarL family, response regulator DesR